MPRLPYESLAEWAGGAQALGLFGGGLDAGGRSALGERGAVGGGGAQALGLLRGALDAGVLSALREPCDVERLAAVTDRSAEWLSAVCRALEAHGSVETAGAGWVLSAPFAALCAEDAQQPLPDFLVSVDARVRALAAGGVPDGGYP